MSQLILGSRRLAAVALIGSAALVLSACSSQDEDAAAPSSTAAQESTVASTDVVTEEPALPTAAELNEIFARATDPAVPVEEKVGSVQGGETAPEIFDTMTRAREETDANFVVVDPIIPGYTPDSALAVVEYSTAEQGGGTAENVEFIFEDGRWKLSQSWACTLITNTVAPEEVPQMCQA